MRKLTWCAALLAALSVAAGCDGGGGGGGGTKVFGPAVLNARGGTGEKGGNGGEVVFAARRGIAAGQATSSRVKLARAPSRPVRDAVEITDLETFDDTEDDLDPGENEIFVATDVVFPDVAITSSDENFTVESGRGNIFVFGDVRMLGSSLSLGTRNGAIVVTGSIDASGDQGHDDGGTVGLFASHVFIRETGKVTVAGADDSPGGGDGGKIFIATFSDIDIAQRRAGFHLGEKATLDLRGGDDDLGGGDGGDLFIDFSATGLVTQVALDGTIDLSGGDGGTGGGGGSGGRMFLLYGTACVIGAEIDLSGGPSTNDQGGAGGKLFVGTLFDDVDLLAGDNIDNVSQLEATLVGVAGERLVLLGDPEDNGETDLDLGGGTGTLSGGSGGGLVAATFDAPIRWRGDIRAQGTTSPAGFDNNTNSGGFVGFFTKGARNADIVFRGSVNASGGDLATTTNGLIAGEGGSIFFVALDGSIDVKGTLDVRGGEATSTANAAILQGGDGGFIALLVDDLDENDEFFGGEGDDFTEDLDNFGGRIDFAGSILARGGNGTASGGDGGTVIMDADGDDGEQPTNGPGRLFRGSTIDVGGGNASNSQGGLGGSGGAVILRASDGSASGTSTDGFELDGADTPDSAVNITGGTGTQNFGRAGLTLFD